MPFRGRTAASSRPCAAVVASPAGRPARRCLAAATERAIMGADGVDGPVPNNPPTRGSAEGWARPRSCWNGIRGLCPAEHDGHSQVHPGGCRSGAGAGGVRPGGKRRRRGEGASGAGEAGAGAAGHPRRLGRAACPRVAGRAGPAEAPIPPERDWRALRRMPGAGRRGGGGRQRHGSPGAAPLGTLDGRAGPLQRAEPRRLPRRRLGPRAEGRPTDRAADRAIPALVVGAARRGEGRARRLRLCDRRRDRRGEGPRPGRAG